MQRDRIEVRDDVQFDPQNVAETASYCRVRNDFLQANTRDAGDAAESLISEMLAQVRKVDFSLGAMFPIYNAWCVVDEITIAHGASNTTRLEANFFVRLGRLPRLRDVNTSES